MKYIIAGIFAFILAWNSPAMAQSSPKLAFNQAANLFIEGQNEQALNNVNKALKRYPNDPQLKALKEKLEQQEEQQQQDQQQQQQENGEENQEQSEEQNGENQPQDSEQQEGEEGEPDDQQEQQQEGEGEESQEQEPQPEEGEEGSEEQEGGELDTERRLQEMNISPEKARMLLEAMKSNEVQYLQQKKREQNKRSDSNRPDW